MTNFHSSITFGNIYSYIPEWKQLDETLVTLHRKMQCCLFTIDLTCCPPPLSRRKTPCPSWQPQPTNIPTPGGSNLGPSIEKPVLHQLIWPSSHLPVWYVDNKNLCLTAHFPSLPSLSSFSFSSFSSSFFFSPSALFFAAYVHKTQWHCVLHPWPSKVKLQIYGYVIIMELQITLWLTHDMLLRALNHLYFKLVVCCASKLKIK